MSGKFKPTIDHVENTTNHYLMQLILRKALRQFGNTNMIPAQEQSVMVFNKSMAVTKPQR